MAYISNSLVVTNVKVYIVINVSKNMKGRLSVIGAGLASLALAAVGCSSTGHSSFFAEAGYNQVTGGVSLYVSDEAGIKRVIVYRGKVRIGSYDFSSQGTPQRGLIEVPASQDGLYFFEIRDGNGGTDKGFFEKRGERVNPQQQGCL